MTDEPTSETTEQSTDREPLRADPTWSRRGMIGVLGGLGLLSVASAPASADGDHVGEMWSGNPASVPYILGLEHTGESGDTHGLIATADSPDGRAITAHNRADTGRGVGILGRSDSNTGHGLYGYASHTTGTNNGLLGETESTQGTGVYGKAKANEGGTKGVRGASMSTGGFGVSGENYAESGSAVGVLGTTNSPDGYGLYTPDDARIDGNTSFGSDIDIDGKVKTVNHWQVDVDNFSGIRIQAPSEYQDQWDRDSTAGGNVIAGYVNEVNDGASGVVIGGGGGDLQGSDTTWPNVVTDHLCTIGGGYRNLAGDEDGDPQTAMAATVGGGKANEASAKASTISGGWHNRIKNYDYGTVGGGDKNYVKGRSATVGGGSRNESRDDYGTIGGGNSNSVSGKFATISGGSHNSCSLDYATVSGGDGNNNGGQYSSIGGGYKNLILGDYATIAGGGPQDPDYWYETKNAVYCDYGTVGGGGGNVAGVDDGDTTTAPFATVSGGENNTASGNRATVPGGHANTADGESSFAAGQYAAADHDHTFVWADGSDSDTEPFSSGDDPNGSGITGPQTFHVKATNGVRFLNDAGTTYIPPGSTGWSTASTRAVKTNVSPVEPQSALDGVESMEVATWEYTDENGDGAGTTHIGPMAEDFHEAFDVGDTDEHINSINADGVAFAAIQGLAERLDDQRADLEEENDQLREQLQEKDDQIADLESRLAAIETHIAE